MTTLIITPSSNTPGKKDYTGAFLPESVAYQKFIERNRGYPSTVRFDNTLPFEKRSKKLLTDIEESGEITNIRQVAIFCHGWSDGIQAGFTRKTVKKLITSLNLDPDRGRLNTDVRFALYCCSTGADPQDDDDEAPGRSIFDEHDNGIGVGEGSFADALRDELCKVGCLDCKVSAHTTAGHTTMNPHVIFFEGLGSTIGGVGGLMPVPPGHKLWKRWVKELKTDFRFEYPEMTVGNIHEILLEQK